ncbi:MAG: metallophosphoesterase family protein [Vicinamibacteria bacterium]
MIRVAAVGDIHLGKDSQDGVLDGLADVADNADLLLIAGDLTQHGLRQECRLLSERLSRISVPSVVVLGNHDLHQGAEDEIRADLETAGVVVLEGESVVVEVAGERVGVAGTKGFGGGFAGACAAEFGEMEMKSFIRHTREIAVRFGESLSRMDADVKIGLTHYAPTDTTLLGERLEIFPFLGSYLLGEAIDGARCHLAIHGHAHLGVERGTTPGGVPVRNVARPVIQKPYKVYCLTPGSTPREGC